ncbi:MAG: transporter permease [Frankiales bacterium]|nr:transporter permease [Frankiales bacterium]
MSNTLTAPTAGAAAPRSAAPVDGQRVTFLRTTKAEWIKLVSLRSSWITFAAAVVAIIGLGALVSYVTNTHWAHMNPQEQAHFDPVSRSLGGVELAQLAIGVLGVLVVTGEYATGMIRSSLMAVPRRLPVLGAKLLVFSACTFVLSLVSAFVAFLLGQQLLGTHGTTLSAPHVLRAVIGVALYLTVVGALAVGLGFVLRSTAGGIATFVGLLLVLPGVGRLLPDTWQPHVLPYLPSNAGAGVFAVQPDTGMLSTWTGYAVFCAWALAALVLGAVVLKRRDA